MIVSLIENFVHILDQVLLCFDLLLARVVCWNLGQVPDHRHELTLGQVPHGWPDCLSPADRLGSHHQHRRRDHMAPRRLIGFVWTNLLYRLLHSDFIAAGVGPADDHGHPRERHGRLRLEAALSGRLVEDYGAAVSDLVAISGGGHFGPALR